MTTTERTNTRSVVLIPRRTPSSSLLYRSLSGRRLAALWLLTTLVPALSVRLQAQTAGEPAIGNGSAFTSSSLYFDSTHVTGSSLDARVSNAQTACGTAPCTIDSRAESSCAISSTITLTKPVHWLLPYCVMSESSMASVVVSSSAAGSSITCDQLWTCIFDGSGNGGGYTVAVNASSVSLVGFKVLGGRKAPQADTGVIFGPPMGGPPITGCIADTLWVVNAGSMAIAMHDCNNFEVKNSVIEKSGGAGIYVDASYGTASGLIADNQLYDAVVNSATSIAPINILSTAGPGATSGVVIRGNHIVQGNLGPSNMGGPSGGWQGTVTVPNASGTQVNWTSGNSFSGGKFLAAPTWNNWHILIGGQVDLQISSVNSGGASLNTTAAFLIQGGGTFPALIYAVPTNPSYKGCGGAAGDSIKITGGTGLARIAGSGTDGNAYGFTSCTFLSGWSGWTLSYVIGATTYTPTILSCSGPSACTLSASSMNGTANSWTVYPTPVDTDTGGGEGIQVSSKAYNITITENYLFNISDEGIVCGNNNCVVTDNVIRNTDQPCNGGCGGVIVSCQTNQAYCTVGPATITGNVIEADSSFGSDLNGQGGTQNSNGNMKYGVWLHVAASALSGGGPCIFEGINVSGNSAAVLGTGITGGTITNGLLVSNDSGHNCTVSPGVNIGPDSWAATTPVNIDNTHFLPSPIAWYGLDNTLNQLSVNGTALVGANLAVGSAGTWTFRNATDNVVGDATTDTFTNKTFDTAGTGNIFKVNGNGINAVTGTGGTVVLGTSPTINNFTLSGTGTVSSANAFSGTNTFASTSTFNGNLLANGGFTFTYGGTSPLFTNPTGNMPLIIDSISGGITSHNLMASVAGNGRAGEFEFQMFHPGVSGHSAAWEFFCVDDGTGNRCYNNATAEPMYISGAAGSGAFQVADPLNCTSGPPGCTSTGVNEINTNGVFAFLSGTNEAIVTSTTANTDVSGVITVLISNSSAGYTFFAKAGGGNYSSPPRCVVSPNLSPTASGVGSFWAVTTTSSLTVHTNAAVTTVNLPFTYVCTVTTI